MAISLFYNAKRKNKLSRLYIHSVNNIHKYIMYILLTKTNCIIYCIEIHIWMCTHKVQRFIHGHTDQIYQNVLLTTITYTSVKTVHFVHFLITKVKWLKGLTGHTVSGLEENKNVGNYHPKHTMHMLAATTNVF